MKQVIRYEKGLKRSREEQENEFKNVDLFGCIVEETASKSFFFNIFFLLDVFNNLMNFLTILRVCEKPRRDFFFQCKIRRGEEAKRNDFRGGTDKLT